MFHATTCCHSISRSSSLRIHHHRQLTSCPSLQDLACFHTNLNPSASMMVDSLPEMTPVIVNTENRTLRRRRSAASAALLSRLPCLHLRTGTLVRNVCSRLRYHDPLFLLFFFAKRGRSKAHLRPLRTELFVDGSSRTVRILDRAAWERLRSHVEELRIVALTSSLP